MQAQGGRARSRTWAGIALLAASLFVFAPAASADNVVSIYGGLFALNGAESRPNDDVLWNNSGFLTFEVDDFNGGIFGLDWHFGVGNFLEVGAGIGYYQRSIDTVYWDYVNDNGMEIPQELELRQIPVSFTARVFPFGRHNTVQPYVGGGLAVVNWQYSEVGEFVDFNNDNEVFRGRFSDDGNVAAPVLIGGVRFPIGDAFRFGGEFRWQGGEADLDPDQGFSGNTLDLGGYQYLATFQFRF
jgi:hypothetical protein